MWWIFPLLRWGFSNPLKLEHLPPVARIDRSDRLFESFSSAWQRRMDAAKATKSEASLWGTIVDFITWREIIRMVFIKLINDGVKYVPVFALSRITSFASDPDGVWTDGLLWAFVIFVANLTETIAWSHWMFPAMRLTNAVEVGLISTVHTKALRLSNAARQQYSEGEIINLVSVDVSRVSQLAWVMHSCWSSPLTLAIGLITLFTILGPSALAGLGVMVVMMPINWLASKKSSQYQDSMMKLKDERVKHLTEALHAIRVLKYFAWENKFISKIRGVRTDEVQQLKWRIALNCLTDFFFGIIPGLVNAATFIAYVYSGHQLTLPTMFSAMLTLQIIRFPIYWLPNTINNVIQGRVALNRLHKFLMAEELEKYANSPITTLSASLKVSKGGTKSPKARPPARVPKAGKGALLDDDELAANSEEAGTDQALAQAAIDALKAGLEFNVESAVKASSEVVCEVKNGTFTWGADDKPSLSNLNIQIKKGSLVILIGKIGSGKSSFLSALLGEMKTIKGSVDIPSNLSIAYTAQKPWIVHDTVKNNVLMGRDDDKAHFSRVVECCSLTRDLEMLPGGESCEIGERGVSISGGQQARVGLARAVYRNADLYLLDDILQAVDVHVGSHIFEEALLKQLAGKTRILVTHQYRTLPHADLILYFEDGQVVKSGSYRELMDQGVKLLDLVKEMDAQAKEHLAELKKSNPSLSSSGGSGGLAKSGQLKRSAVLKKSSTSLGKSTSSLGHSQGIEDNAAAAGVGIAPQVGDLILTDDTASEASITESSEISETVEEEFVPPKPNDGSMVEEEERAVGALKFDVLKKYLADFGWILIVACIFTLSLTQGILLFKDWFISNWVKSVSEAEIESTVSTTMGWFVGLTIIAALISFAEEVMVLAGVLKAAQSLHDKTLARVFRAPTRWFDTTPVGRIINRFSKDQANIDTELQPTLQDFATCALNVLAVVLMVCIATPLIIPLLVVLTVGYFFIQRYFIATSRELQRLRSVNTSPIYSHFSEMLNGTTTIRAYGMEARFSSLVLDKLETVMAIAMPTVAANRWLSNFIGIIGSSVSLGACLAGIASKQWGIVDAALFGLALANVIPMIDALNWMVRMLGEAEMKLNSVERMHEYQVVKKEALLRRKNDPLEAAWPTVGKVEFQDVVMRYRPELDPVLRKVSFSVKGGSKTGIVGRTGAGKSSTMMALFRMVELEEGKILIDGTDISKLGLHCLRSSLSIIPQDPILFRGSIRSNLDPFDENDNVALWSALQRVALKDKISQEKDKLDSEVVESGQNFSVGERQLLCLARALVHKAKVLVLDEATAACDAETDALIQKVLRSEFNDCTILTIAHRLHTIMDYDQILVFDAGQCVENGTPSELIKNGGVFSTMVKQQTGR